VHRIVATVGGKLITRGDHNRLCDSAPLHPQQLVGRVEQVQTDEGIKPVMNGPQGRLRAEIRREFLVLDLLIRKLLWRPYRWLRQHGWVGRIWKPQITRLQVQTGDGILVKYLHLNRTVATWDAGQRRFTCRKPYDLVIPAPLEESDSSS